MLLLFGNLESNESLTAFCHCSTIAYCMQSLLQTEECSWVCAYLSPLEVCRIHSSTTNTGSQGRRHQISNGSNSPCSVSSIFSNRPLLSVCGEQPMDVSTTWVVWGFLWGPFDQQLNRYNLFPALETSFRDESCAAGALSTPLFSNFIWIKLIFQEASTVLDFHATSQTFFLILATHSYSHLCAHLHSLFPYTLALPAHLTLICLSILLLLLWGINSSPHPRTLYLTSWIYELQLLIEDLQVHIYLLQHAYHIFLSASGIRHIQ